MSDIPPANIPPAYDAPPATGVRHRATTSEVANTDKTSAQPQGRLASLGNEARASAVRQVGGVAATASEAVTSGAWAYPIRGALYILRHPKLIGPILPVLVRAVLISAGVVVACFFFLYLPQVAWLALFTGPLAFIAAVPLVLGEAYVLLNFFGKRLLFGQLSLDLFDAVLVQKGHAALVEKGRPVTTQNAGGKTVRHLGKALTSPLNKLSTDNVVRYLLTLPLNFIPVVGTAFFLGYNGYKSGPGALARFYELKGWDKTRRDQFIEKRRGAFTGFGVVSTVFNMVPVVGIVLSLASSVGAALWASDLEAKNADPSAGEVDVAIPAPSK